MSLQYIVECAKGILIIFLFPYASYLSALLSIGIMIVYLIKLSHDHTLSSTLHALRMGVRGYWLCYWVDISPNDNIRFLFIFLCAYDLFLIICFFFVFSGFLFCSFWGIILYIILYNYSTLFFDTLFYFSFLLLLIFISCFFFWFDWWLFSR